MVDYDTLTLERAFSCSADTLFHLITDREHRQKWSAPDDKSVVIIDAYDCRPGGREETRCGPKDAPEFNTIGLFHVVTPEFLSFTETLIVGGQTLSISLCSHEILARGNGSALNVTLQITSLAGSDLFAEYQGGWSAALDNLGVLATAPDLH